MPVRPHFLLSSVLAAGLAFASHGARAGEQHSGDFVIRYNALTAAALPSAATIVYGLSRSNTQGVLIVTVERGGRTGVPATVRGHAATLLGHAVALKFRSVDENASTLGTFTVPGNGSVRFDLDVTPQGGATTHIEFVQDFVVD
jgi:hypothetical protein